MSTADHAATDSLAAAVLAVPGVVRLYPATNLVAQVGSTIGSVVTGAAPRDDIAVRGDRVVVRLGVDSERSAAGICRAVFEVCRSWAEMTGLGSAVIEVTAATIDDGIRQHRDR